MEGKNLIFDRDSTHPWGTISHPEECSMCNREGAEILKRKSGNAVLNTCHWPLCKDQDCRYSAASQWILEMSENPERTAHAEAPKHNAFMAELSRKNEVEREPDFLQALETEDSVKHLMDTLFRVARQERNGEVLLLEEYTPLDAFKILDDAKFFNFVISDEGFRPKKAQDNDFGVKQGLGYEKSADGRVKVVINFNYVSIYIYTISPLFGARGPSWILHVYLGYHIYHILTRMIVFIMSLLQG